MKKVLTLASVFALLITITSCEKKGCIDPLAMNYDSKASANDGSCQYQGKLIIWQDQTYADQFVSVGTSTLKFYINGSLVGSMAASTYGTSAPSCGENGFATITQDLGSNDSKLFTVTVKDENNDDITDFSVTLRGGQCVSYQLQ